MAALDGLYYHRVPAACMGLPLIMFFSVIILEQRREPLETFMDRDWFFHDYHSNTYGVYFDHHKYAHMLAHRRAHKWGYEDVTLAGSDH
mmetsp:Transcript_4235/g.6486  ORF Transcript_4235/g.6486 Transcript_4235/m.6486 type:complete len:89 (+) Transcript_4235:26-292(+)